MFDREDNVLDRCNLTFFGHHDRQAAENYLQRCHLYHKLNFVEFVFLGYSHVSDLLNDDKNSSGDCAIQTFKTKLSRRSPWNRSKFVVSIHRVSEFLHQEPCCRFDVTVYVLKYVVCRDKKGKAG